MNPEELIERNFERLKDEPYRPARVFREPTYDWPGDMEGRAMLAFVCHYLIHGKKVPQFDEVFRDNDLHVNQDGYYGALFNPEAIDEQQLAGNSWYLRGLLAYGDAFHDSKAYAYAKSTIEKLYKPALKVFPQYPVQRDGVVLGGVYGNLSAQLGKWKLSSDIGCAFIALDGIGHYYQRFPDQELHDLLVPAIDFFLGLDREGLHAQSHGTLSALRGILCFYEQTKEERYLVAVEKVFRLYREKAMTLNYDCYNWFGRPETWSEPCAVTDSLILATKLYKITKKENIGFWPAGFSSTPSLSPYARTEGPDRIPARRLRLPASISSMTRHSNAARCVTRKGCSITMKTRNSSKKRRIRSFIRREPAISEAIIFFAKT